MTPPLMDPVAQFFAKYPVRVAALAGALRALVIAVLPDADETLDESGRVVGYAVGAGYTGLVCTIIPSKTGVKLGIVRGAELPDPKGLLKGSGKRHRYVQVETVGGLDQAGLNDLLRAARTLAASKRDV